MLPANNKKRVHIWVKGRVQGVGFRAFVYDEALKIGVVGWVRNVGWNTVEAVAEGTNAQVDSFVEMMKRGPRLSRVDESQVEVEPVGGELAAFSVERSG